MISASLIVSGLMRQVPTLGVYMSKIMTNTCVISLVQIIRIRIPKTRFYIGAGLLQITGVAFCNVPAAQALIQNMYKSKYHIFRNIAEHMTDIYSRWRMSNRDSTRRNNQLLAMSRCIWRCIGDSGIRFSICDDSYSLSYLTFKPRCSVHCCPLPSASYPHV